MLKSLIYQQKSSLLLPAILIIMSILAFIAPSSTRDLLEFKREMISQGEFWRLFTGHFFHTNLNHLLLNLAAVVLLWFLHGEFYQKLTSILFLISICLLTALGIYFFALDIHWYVGLSGILHGLFIWGAIKDIESKRITGYLLLIGVVMKLIYEQLYGADPSVSSLIDANVAIDAHLWGAISGAVISIVLLFIDKVQLTSAR